MASWPYWKVVAGIIGCLAQIHKQCYSIIERVVWGQDLPASRYEDTIDDLKSARTPILISMLQYVGGLPSGSMITLA